MINKQKTFENIRKEFGKLNQSQVDGFDYIFDYWEQSKNTDIRKLCYMLATVWHECAHTMQPIWEYGKGKGRIYGKMIKQDRKAYSFPKQIYYGRGFVQLTWYENYEKLGKVLGIDLLNNPDLALDLENATKILFYGMETGIFTSRKLSQYFNDKINDPIGARKIINGNDKAELICNYHLKFLKSIV